MLNREWFKVYGHRSVDFKRLGFYHFNVEPKKKKKGTNEPIYKAEIESQMQKANLRLHGGEGLGEG